MNKTKNKALAKKNKTPSCSDDDDNHSSLGYTVAGNVIKRSDKTKLLKSKANKVLCLSMLSIIRTCSTNSFEKQTRLSRRKTYHQAKVKMMRVTQASIAQLGKTFSNVATGSNVRSAKLTRFSMFRYYDFEHEYLYSV